MKLDELTRDLFAAHDSQIKLSAALSTANEAHASLRVYFARDLEVAVIATSASGLPEIQYKKSFSQYLAEFMDMFKFKS